MTLWEYLLQGVKVEVVPPVDMKEPSGKNRMFLPSSLYQDEGFVSKMFHFWVLKSLKGMGQKEILSVLSPRKRDRCF